MTARPTELREFLKENRKQILLSIFLFWLIFAVLVAVEDKLALRLANEKSDPLDQLQYIIRWVLWTLLTPFIIFLAIRFPVRSTFVIRDLIKHFFFALLVVAIEFSMEIPVIRYATLRMTGLIHPISDYAAIFILKLNIYLLLYFLVVGTTYLVLYIDSDRRSRLLAQEAELSNRQLQAQLSAAKLRFLKMQLDPHFLFNTHHAIVSLMLDKKNEQAIQMLTKLSELLRLSLEDSEQTVPLEKEIHLLKLYLDIQQIRFSDRLRILFDVHPETLMLPVPSFILQPLVENAIKHGIAISSQAGTISIASKMENNNLVLSVENDGRIFHGRDFTEGIGISNTRERLFQLYKTGSDFNLTNGKHSGAMAVITIPISQ